MQTSCENRFENQPEQGFIGKYGRIRRQYLKEHRPVVWAQMVMKGTLFPHLYAVDQAAYERLDHMIPALAESAGATEALKAADPMKWVGLMNACKAQAEEVILEELIYT